MLSFVKPPHSSQCALFPEPEFFFSDFFPRQKMKLLYKQSIIAPLS
jgi:hypothetical protein